MSGPPIGHTPYGFQLYETCCSKLSYIKRTMSMIKKHSVNRCMYLLPNWLDVNVFVNTEICSIKKNSPIPEFMLGLQGLSFSSPDALLGTDPQLFDELVGLLVSVLHVRTVVFLADGTPVAALPDIHTHNNPQIVQPNFATKHPRHWFSLGTGSFSRNRSVRAYHFSNEHIIHSCRLFYCFSWMSQALAKHRAQSERTLLIFFPRWKMLNC